MSLSDRLEELREQPAATPAERLHALFDALWEHRIDAEPELATYLGEPGPTHRWTDKAIEAFDRRRADHDLALGALREFEAGADARQLGDVDQTSLRLAVHEYDAVATLGRFPHELLAAHTMDGPQVEIPQVISLMPARTLGDLEDVVARLSGIPVLIDQAIGLLEEGAAREVTIPRVVAAQLAPNVRSLAEAPDDATPLLLPFATAPEGVDASDLADLRVEALDALESARSALGRFATYLDATYAPACRESTAFSALPDGAEWYAALVRHQTTTDLTPEEIHALGLDEVKRIRKEMESVISSTDAPPPADGEDTFAAFSEFLRTDNRFYFATAEALLAHYRDLSKRADAELPRLFGLLPRLPYGVKAIDDHEAPTAPAAFYLPGSLEIGRPGWFCANTYDLRARPRYEMEATCLHEGVPGHHLQIALAAELEGLPKFRTKGWGYTAYVEGWGLYAESLGQEMGFYRDPYDRFGQLASELLRAIRLVVDTGLHALGWSREQAIAYFTEYSTTPRHEIVTEVDRYLSIPGQALAYKVGELTITRLRAELAAALGDAFDLRSFHDLVLGAGALPLGVLEERARAWADSRSR